MRLVVAIVIALSPISAGPGREENRTSSAPAASGGSIQQVLDRAGRAVVKLYGARAGGEQGYGTGVLISAEGLIVTTRSMLVGGSAIRVVLHDGRRFDGHLVRTDERRQLALVKIEAKSLPFLAPASDAAVQPGDPVWALANWFKIADGREAVSVTRGIVSLIQPLAAKRKARELAYDGPAIHCDAITSNPGAAGGALVDVEGRLVGLIGKPAISVNTNTSLSYALPASEVMAFLTAPTPPPANAPAPARLTTAALGFRVARLGYRHQSAYVERVRADSPAGRAGLRTDDLIIALEGRRIADANDLDESLAKQPLERSVHLTVKRGQEVLELELKLGDPP